jgi:Fe-S oxidoreductase
MKDIILFENYNNNNFKQETNKIIKKFEDLLKDYDEYILSISPSNWRSSGTVYKNLNDAIETIKKYKELTDEEILSIFDMGIPNKDKITFQEKYPELYQKYLKQKTKNKFNL